MRCLLLLLLATPVVAQTLPLGADPRAVVSTATRAIEGDSAARLRARWFVRLERAPSDRATLLGLATIARLEYEYPDAERTYTRLIATGRDRFALYAHLGLAEGYAIRSFNNDSRRQMDQALALARELRDPIGEAEALLLLAFTRGRLEGVRVAEAILDTAAHIIPETELDLRARLYNRNAIVHALQGRAAEASFAADTAIAFARRARVLRVEADAQRTKGQVLQYRGQWDSALVVLHQSEQLYLKSNNRSALATSLIWQAQVLGSMARYGEMRDVMQRALTEGEATHNPAAVADAYRAFGVLAEMSGDWPAALAHLKKSVAISESSGDSSGVRTTSKYVSKVALAVGDIATAKRMVAAELDDARKKQDYGGRYEAARSLAGIAQRESDYAGALRLLAEARAQLPRLPGSSYRVWLAHDEGRLALNRGDLTSATKLLESFIAGSAGAIGNVVRFDSRVRLADAYARLGNLARAERELSAATDDIDTYRAQLTDAQLRSLAFQLVATVDASAFEPEAIATSMARVIGALAEAGRADGAFLLSERWRARELADRLVRASALRTTTAKTPPAKSLSAAKPHSAREIAAALPNERVALLEYVAIPGAPVTLFVVQKGRTDARVLRSDSLEQTVARFRSLVESGADASRLARTLGSALIDPALAVLDTRVTRLIIVADGPLHRLPFDALRLSDGKYLLERYATGFAPSASVAAGLWSRERVASSAPLRMLALGDPAVGSATRAGVRAAAADVFLAAAKAAGGLPRLHGAAREARRVARYAPNADVRVGKDASAAFLKRANLQQYRVLHFATHAIVDEKSIAGTALALAPGGGENGFVGAGDLAALRINADLVVLSACSSAGGVISGREGVQGLTSSLLQAGARSLVATGWRIPDRDVVPLVERFYSELSKGLPAIDALRNAKLYALHHRELARTWAGFTVVGDPLVTVPLRSPSLWNTLWPR